MSLPKILKNHGTVQLLVLATVFFYAFVFFVRDVDSVRLLRLGAVDGLYHDRYRAIHGRGGHETSIVIVSIDDESLQKLAERWPWRRTLMADLLTKATSAGARLVAFDLSFTVPSERASDDTAFADAVRKSGRAVLSWYFGAGEGSVEPLPALADAALDTGFLNTPRDPDNSNRRTWPSLVSSDGRERISFSAAIAGRAMGTPAADLVSARLLASGIAGTPGRQGDDPGVWTPYDYALEDFEVVPFWKIVRGEASQSLIKDRILIVGATGEIFHDMYRTPLGVMPGVALHANQVMNYLNGKAVRQFPDRVFYTVLLALMLALTLAFSKLRLGRGLLLLALALLAVREAALRLFLNGVLIDVFSAAAVVGAAFVIGTMYRSVALLIENQGLRYQTLRDGLTDLYTYRYMEFRLKAEFDKARKSGEDLSFVIFDIDHFKKFNDNYGHEKGNEILMAFARILKYHTRGEDLVARYGGEEFCLLLPKKNKDEAFQIAERIRTSLESSRFRFTRKGEKSPSDIQVTVSAGICSAERPEVFNGKELLRLADGALLSAKERGRNRTCLCGE